MKPGVSLLALASVLVFMPQAGAQPTPRTEATNVAWTSGLYTYDGSGNIVSIGPNSDGKTDAYQYDPAGRLKVATAHTTFANNNQSYLYDAFGNLTQVTTSGVSAAIDVSPASNHLRTSPYDAAGNQSSNGTNTYSYDALNAMTSLTSPSGAETYLYDADDQRVAIVTGAASSQHWRVTLRDVDGRVIREYADDTDGTTHQWQWVRDYVHSPSSVLVEITPLGAGEARRHFHVDHLGTPRLITDDQGAQVARQTLWPFGAFAPGSDRSGARLVFTGHERDYSSSGDDNTLDYMHARFYSAAQGRFLSVDPSQRSVWPAIPQSWNRYGYAIDNPLRYVDPYGLDWFKIDGTWQYVKDAHEMQYDKFDKNGKLISSQTLKGTKFALVFNGTKLTELREDGTTRTFPAASGKISGWGEVHPELQGSPKRGPIPAGLYTFNRADIQDWNGPNADAYLLATLLGRGWRGGTHAWGTMRVPLKPAPGTNTYGRGGFFLHGGAVPGSAGCIDLCDRVVDVLSNIPRSVDTVTVDVDYGHPLSPP